MAYSRTIIWVSRFEALHAPAYVKMQVQVHHIYMMKATTFDSSLTCGCFKNPKNKLSGANSTLSWENKLMIQSNLVFYTMN